jgi:glucose-6-phosphate isomerase
LAERPDGSRITPLFAADSGRAARFTAHFDDLSLDFSKSSIDDTALDTLFALAETAGLEDFRRRLFGGEPVNETEHRAAMHMALRAPAAAGLKAIMPRGTEDAAGMAATERDKMRRFVEAVHGGQIKGATGQSFTDVLTIGIGGSDLGPKVATEALTIGRSDARMRAHFLSNVDGHAFADVTQGLDPARTLVLVASKTFTTLETAMNAAAARAWIVAALGDSAVAAHFAALSTNLKAVAAFGMNPDRVFAFQDWVGGRYSLWSPVGLVIPLAAGWDKFQQMLDGAWAMDCHFRDAPLRQNLPVLLMTIGCAGCRRICSSLRWNRTASTSCCRDRRLAGTPARSCLVSLEPMRSTVSCSLCIRGRGRCRWISSWPPMRIMTGRMRIGRWPPTPSRRRKR